MANFNYIRTKMLLRFLKENNCIVEYGIKLIWLNRRLHFTLFLSSYLSLRKGVNYIERISESEMLLFNAMNRRYATKGFSFWKAMRKKWHDYYESTIEK